MGKKGISLVLLTVILIIMSILAFTIVITLSDSIDDSKEVAFAVELKEIHEAAQSYYLQNGKYPVDESVSYTKSDLLGISINSQALQEEFEINQDIATKYYRIELSKIAKTEGFYGNNDNEADFYVISEDGNFVYYPLGVEIDGVVYFSLTSKISQINDEDLSKNTNEDVQSVFITSRISVLKSTDKWTNSLELTVNTKLEDDETLYYIVGDVKTPIAETLPYTLKLSYDTITTNSEMFSELSEMNDVIFQKEDENGKVIAKTSVNVENLDIISPTIGDPVIVRQNDCVIVKFSDATDDKSGVACSYYGVSDIDYTATQLISAGSKGETYKIKLDLAVAEVQFVVVDNAGNASLVKTVSIE